MSKPNNFNPFTEPYHPYQLVLVGSIVLAALPGTFLFGFIDKWKTFKDTLSAVNDIPKSARDTWQSYSK